MGLTGLGSQTRPCLRITIAIVVVLVLSIFYFANDISTFPHTEFFWKSTDYNGFITFQGTFESNVSDDASYNTTVKEGYLVWSPYCRIPDIDPMHESIRNLVKKVDPVTCSNMIPLTTVVNHHLLFNHRVAPQYSQNQKMKCCYKTIWRPVNQNQPEKHNKPDDYYELSSCHEFHSDVMLNNTIEYILVECTVPLSKGGKKKDVYKNMHSFAVKKTPRHKSTKSIISTAEKPQEPKLNVLILGIDGVSRLNFMRSMPSSAALLDEQGWVEMKGYNKIEDNTFPNLIAILTGKTLPQLRKLCWPSASSKLDNCPILWNNFSNQGYLTAYAEDEPQMATFNYEKKGFTTIPTDYYFRPFMFAAKEHMSAKWQDGLRVCIGPTSTTEHILKYMMDLWTSVQEAPYFGLIWLNNFSHNGINQPSSMDRRFHKLFKDLLDRGVLNNTAVFFISDHGCRTGKIRETFVGWLEERLPFMHVWLPTWFRNMYPNKFKNLLTNSNRLTTPFDVFMTLHEIANDTNVENVVSTGCPKCVSLFSQVPWNRSCEDASITKHWCTCSEFRTLSTEGDFVRSMVDFVVNEINTLVRNGRNSTTPNMKCAKLTARRILSVRSTVFEKTVKQDHFVIMFETVPGEGIFEATVKNGQRFQLVDSVSRVSMYGSQSSCMKNAFLKKYCYCVKK